MFNSTHSIILSIVLTLSVPTIARCDDAVTTNSQTSNWNIEFEPVPEILRLHCPPLQSGQGLVVKRIGDDFDAQFQLNAGDILLSASGIAIRNVGDLPGQVPAHVMVMRRGQITPLGQGRRFCGWNGYRPGFMNPAMMQQRQGGVSASSYADGNESVSVSQSGNQISLDMSLPGLDAGNISYRGTRDQIQREVESSNLPPAAIQRVLEAIQ
ncbi:hypothetical protein LF1_33040 [Rubripirellula obstinata]|uniref:PDZ domain-containing protein n=1 Tax=Rubripirellula obstinata TaxID=406547 RepID=A0A5B1CN20_9BACT|nr:hypothetical protein [Rubripirellula obstinata]KAA1260763.1 hypothetical protein LF1_33040 [Rubripirellula obstinata]